MSEQIEWWELATIEELRLRRWRTINEIVSWATGLDHKEAKEAHKKLCWELGDRAALEWKAEHGGKRPRIGLMPKSDESGGTQEKAIYPPDWQRRIGRWAKESEGQKKRQGELFGPASWGPGVETPLD